MRDDYYALCSIHAKLTKRHRCLDAALRQSIKQQFVCFSCSSNTQYRAKPSSPKLKLCVRKKTAISDINSSFLVGTAVVRNGNRSHNWIRHQKSSTINDFQSFTFPFIMNSKSFLSTDIFLACWFFKRFMTSLHVNQFCMEFHERPRRARWRNETLLIH